MHYFGLVFLIVYSSCIFALDRQKRYTEPTQVVAPGLLPWVVKMTNTGGTFTGVLISDRHIVTVAHALDSFPDADCLKAHFKNALTPFSVKASRYILYSKFDSSRIIYNYDFAIVELKRGAQEKQENKRQQIEELTEKVKGLSKENRELRMEAEGLRRQNQALNTDNQGLRSCVSYLQAENECFSKQLEKAQYVLRELRESLNAMPHWAQEPMTAASPPMGSNGAGHSGSYQQSGTHNELATPSDEATNSSNEHSELPSVDDMPHGEQQPISTTSPSKAQSTTSVQKKPMSLCFHYYRLCLLKFDCCRFYFPCHRCHNESDLCEVTNKLPFDAKQFQCSLCKYEGDITENSQKCPGCHQQMSEYFCARCKLFTSSERSMFHCDKCDACHRSKDKLFHCDVCNLCLDINLQSTHKCRQISGRETCCICLEEVPGSRFVLPCSHQVHGECGLAMVQNRLKHCPVCRHPLYP